MAVRSHTICTSLASFFRVAIPALVIAACISPVTDVRGEEAKQWQALLDRGRAHLARGEASLDAVARELPGLYPETDQRLLEMEIRLHRLMAIYVARWKTPMSLIDVEEQIRAINVITAEIIAPLKKQERVLSAMQQFHFRIAETQRVLAHEGVREGLLPPGITAGIADFKRQSNELYARASELKAELSPHLADAYALRDRVDGFRRLLRKDLAGVIRAYYLVRAPHLFSMDGWRQGCESLARWVFNFRAADLIFNQYDNTLWVRVILHTLIAMALLIIAARAALARLQARAGLTGLTRRLLPPIAWLAAGASTIIGIQLPAFTRSGFLFMIVWLFVSRGLVSLGERLKAGSPGDENEKAGRTAGGLWIITPFWVAVAAGNILQSLDLRAESLAILWSAALLLCWWYTLRLKGVAHGTGRAAQSSLLWLLFALLVCALLGWVNIAIFSTTIILVPCIGGVLAAGIRAAHPKLEPVITMPRGRDLAVKIVRTVLDYPNVFIISVYFGWAGYLFYIGNVQLLGKALSLRWEWRSVSFHLVNIPLIIAGYFAARSGITVVQELIPVFHRSEEDSTEGRVLSLQALTGYIVWILYVMVSLSLLGFSMGHLALVAGGLSVGIGFGLQQTVNNFISGLILLLGRDIQPGDMLERDGSFCRVEKVTIRNTILRTYTGKTIVVPNSEFVTKPFFNWTYRTSRIRGEIVVRVVAAADSRQVEELLLTVVRANPRVLKFPAPSVRLDDFGGGKLEFSLRIWVAHPGEWGVISDLRHEINRELREKGIAMA